jgi:hypothetical protein
MKGGFYKLAKNVVSQIKFEIDQIDGLLDSYTELLNRSQKSKPDLIEITAIASVLHSFYNGVENIFLSIAKGIDNFVPEGFQWHRNLLLLMTQKTAKRSHVISEKMAQNLAQYLGFRHFYRHSYSFFLEWSEVEKLVIPLQKMWAELKNELGLFMNSLG